MSTPLFLVLALLQAPAAANTFNTSGVGGDFHALVRATEPVLAPRAEAAAPPLAIRASSTDAWGCVYGSSYYCRHLSAVADGSGRLMLPVADPCPWTGQCVGLYPSGSSFDAGQFVAWQWKWGPAIEFEQTNRGLIDGKPIVEARAREAAARDAARSSLQTPTYSSSQNAGGYSPPGQSYSPPPAASGGDRPASAAGKDRP